MTTEQQQQLATFATNEALHFAADVLDWELFAIRRSTDKYISSAGEELTEEETEAVHEALATLIQQLRRDLGMRQSIRRIFHEQQETVLS